MKNIGEYLKNRWGVRNIWQVLIILLVFALTGFSAMFAKKPIFMWLGITPATPVWVRVSVWVLTILPIYQVLLLFYGFLFGQYTFFLNFEKKTLGRIFQLFKKNKTNNNTAHKTIDKS
jgi:hypothetical protein